MSSEDIKHTFVSTVLKHFLATTVKLNGPNYLLCSPDLLSLLTRRRNWSILQRIL